MPAIIESQATVKDIDIELRKLLDERRGTIFRPRLDEITEEIDKLLELRSIYGEDA